MSVSRFFWMNLANLLWIWRVSSFQKCVDLRLYLVIRFSLKTLRWSWARVLEWWMNVRLPRTYIHWRKAPLFFLFQTVRACPQHFHLSHCPLLLSRSSSSVVFFLVLLLISSSCHFQLSIAILSWRLWLVNFIFKLVDQHHFSERKRTAEKKRIIRLMNQCRKINTLLAIGYATNSSPRVEKVECWLRTSGSFLSDSIFRLR